MKNHSYLLLITLLAFLTSQTILAKSQRHRNNGNDGGRRNKNGQRNGRNRNIHEGFSCPEMACPPVNPTCRNVEYLVLQFVESDSSNDLVFECRGCDYCIDLRNLQKRAIRRHHDVHARLRKRFQCPGVIFGCRDVRTVNVFIPGLHGQSWLCPACFDHVLPSSNN